MEETGDVPKIFLAGHPLSTRSVYMNAAFEFSSRFLVTFLRFSRFLQNLISEKGKI